MFKIIMIIAASLLALGWIAYGIWNYREDQAEKKGGKKTTEHLKKVKDSFEEYTRKMENYKRKDYDRE